MPAKTITYTVKPLDALATLSPSEVKELQNVTPQDVHALFRKCALAVLNCGSHIDDAKKLLALYPDFDIKIQLKHGGVGLELMNAPASAFVDGELIEGIREQLFSVLRDLVYVVSQSPDQGDVPTGEATTDQVFKILRHADVLRPSQDPNIVVCWGGHSINKVEYDYTKKVGYELGLRGYDVCTGCGPGAMKGPMKGALIAHAKQRTAHQAAMIGLSEPSIIAAESPNPIVNKLIVLPDIEKRLEAFVRLGHGIIVFPGGAGTAEEILYLLSILLHEQNSEVTIPVVLTGPGESAEYFRQIDQFIGFVLGKAAQDKYQIIIDDPEQVARVMKDGLCTVKEQRKRLGDAYHYNWWLYIPEGLQAPFEPSHQNMACLRLSRTLPVSELASELRKAMSGIVAGNVKEQWATYIQENGPYTLSGDEDLMGQLDTLLASFVAQGRMKIGEYTPCYRVLQS